MLLTVSSQLAHHKKLVYLNMFMFDKLLIRNEGCNYEGIPKNYDKLIVGFV